MRFRVTLLIALCSTVWGCSPEEIVPPSAPIYEIGLQEASIPMPDGVRLAADLFVPEGGADGERFPVLLEYLPYRKAESRSRNYALYSYFVQRGYIVVQVDVRGSTGYGRAFREEFLLDFTGEDLDDVESAANYMATLPYVDAKRMGIWGSSYGGTLTV